MGNSREPTRHLLDRAQMGESIARDLLLERYRERLKRSVVLRLDARVAARVDPSDIVQETLSTVSRRLDDYLRDRPMPFLDWLKRIARERVIDAHRTHILAQRRSVARENSNRPPGSQSDETSANPIEEIPDPKERGDTADRLDELQKALQLLRPQDRQIVIMRHIEHLSPAKIALRLGINEGTAKVRIVRALLKLREILTKQE